MANQFDYYDMITGEKKKLPTFPFYARLHKIESPYRFIFYADGTNHLNQERKFPFIIECYRNIKGEEFHWNHLNRYFPIVEKIEFGGKKSKAVLKDLKVTLNGLEASFGPRKGHKEEFFAGYTDIPCTETYGNQKKINFLLFLERHNLMKT